MSDIRASKAFRTTTDLLRHEASERGISLTAGEAATIIAGRVDAVAHQLGVTPRTALTSYLTPHAIGMIVDSLAEQSAVYLEAADHAPPMTVSVAQAGRALAALAMTISLANDHGQEDPEDTASMIHLAADVAVRISGDLGQHDGTPTLALDGALLIEARLLLSSAVERLDEGRWNCGCTPTHPAGPVDCPFRATFVHDLVGIGGQPPPTPGRDSHPEPGMPPDPFHPLDQLDL